MAAEMAGPDAAEMLRAVLRSHLATGPLRTGEAVVLDEVVDAVVCVLRRLEWAPAAPDLLADIRHFHDDSRLAASNYASGEHVAERAAVARQRIRDEVACRFGDTPLERVMHDAVVWGYLDPKAGHAVAQRTLHLSRATYFRVLRRARERLAS